LTPVIIIRERTNYMARRANMALLDEPGAEDNIPEIESPAGTAVTATLEGKEEQDILEIMGGLDASTLSAQIYRRMDGKWLYLDEIDPLEIIQGTRPETIAKNKFGGGTYRIFVRGGVGRKRGSILTKKEFDIEGVPRSIEKEPATPVVTVPIPQPVQTGPSQEVLMILDNMRKSQEENQRQNQEQMKVFQNLLSRLESSTLEKAQERQDRLIEAMITRNAGGSDKADLLAVIKMVSEIFSKMSPAQQPPAPAPVANPLEQIKTAEEISKNRIDAFMDALKMGMEMQQDQQSDANETTTQTVIKTLGQVLSPLMEKFGPVFMAYAAANAQNQTAAPPMPSIQVIPASLPAPPVEIPQNDQRQEDLEVAVPPTLEPEVLNQWVKTYKGFPPILVGTVLKTRLSLEDCALIKAITDEQLVDVIQLSQDEVQWAKQLQEVL
jgi:hypothetical protein